MSDQTKAPVLALQKLRSENEDLRNELRQISSKLDEVLAKQSIEPPQPKEGKRNSDDRNLKISSIQKLIAAIEREIETLKSSANSGSIEYKLKLEEETATLKDKVKEALLKNKDLQRQVIGSSRKIEALGNADEPNGLKIILEELRTSKEKLKEIDTKYQGELQRSSMIKAKITELENEARSKDIDLNTLGQGKASYNKKSDNPAVDQGQKSELERTMAELEKAKGNIILSTKKKVAEFEEGKNAIKVEMEKSSRVLKEKDHEIKLKEHEINDLRRTLRNLQTKMNSMPNIMIEGTKEAKGEKKVQRKAGKSEVREEDKPKELRVRQLSIHDEKKKGSGSDSSSESEKKPKKKGSDSDSSSKKH